MQVLCRKEKNFYNLLTLGFASDAESGNKSEYECRRSPSRRSRETARECTEESALIDGFSHALCDKIAESRQRYRRSRSREINKMTVNSYRAEEDARNYVSDKDARGSKSRSVDQYLCDGAKRASDEKSPQVW